MMQRLKIKPREDFGEKLESQGLSFHGWDNYWKEDACYRFTLKQIEEIESATAELHAMCIAAMKMAVTEKRLDRLGIPETFWPAIEASIAANNFSLYGRFDLAYDGKSPPKLLEYNADTPTSLLESAVCQWYWMKDCYPDCDQFNSLHESLVKQWRTLSGNSRIHLASVANNEEDWVCTTYLMDTLIQAGRLAKHIDIEDIAWDSTHKRFVDVDGMHIETLFKLYPWEWLMREDFGQYIAESKTQFIEPMYKAIMSCKGLLPLLWELYPDHPNLLAAWFDRKKLSAYARKPLYSREGANIDLVSNGRILAQDGGPYGSEGYIYQALYSLPKFDGRYPVIGSWVVNGEAVGMCIREDDSPITTNMSNFVPHFFTD